LAAPAFAKPASQTAGVREVISVCISSSLEGFRRFTGFSLSADCFDVAGNRGCAHFGDYSGFRVKLLRLFVRKKW
jgi:hypothetical protein